MTPPNIHRVQNELKKGATVENPLVTEEIDSAWDSIAKATGITTDVFEVIYNESKVYDGDTFVIPNEEQLHVSLPTIRIGMNTYDVIYHDINGFSVLNQYNHKILLLDGVLDFRNTSKLVKDIIGVSLFIAVLGKNTGLAREIIGKLSFDEAVMASHISKIGNQ